VLRLKKFDFPNKVRNNGRKTKRKNPSNTPLILKQWNDGLSTTASTTATFYDLTQVPQGTTFRSRVGAQIRLHKLIIRMFFNGADTTNRFRVIFFKWKMSDTSDQPTTSELLIDPNFPITTPILAYSPSRFKILSDMTFNLVTNNWQGALSKVVSFSAAQLGLAQYDVGVNTGVGHIYVMVVSDSGASTHPAYELSADLRFSD